MALIHGSGVAAMTWARAGEKVSRASACMRSSFAASALTLTLYDLSSGSGWFTYLRHQSTCAMDPWPDSAAGLLAWINAWTSGFSWGWSA
jgi:hypothetical protein